jgi:uncharacterized protein involved in tolerance to divalent cations
MTRSQYRWKERYWKEQEYEWQAHTFVVTTESHASGISYRVLSSGAGRKLPNEY